MNVELFDKVKALMRENPDRVNMEVWFDRKHCGTTACIAGWTVLAAGINPENVNGRYGRDNMIAKKAIKLLGLDVTPSLFYSDEWPEALEDELMSAESDEPRKYVEVCCKAIDAFIADPSQFGER